MVKSYRWGGGGGGPCDYCVTPVPIGLGFWTGLVLGLGLGLRGLDLGLGLTIKDNLQFLQLIRAVIKTIYSSSLLQVMAPNHLHLLSSPLSPYCSLWYSLKCSSLLMSLSF